MKQHKANVQIRSLKEILEFRLSGSASIDTVSEITKDANGWPIIFLSDGAGNVAAGDDVIAIRMKGVDAISKDIFGNDLVAYTPHVIEFAYELDVNGKPEPVNADIMKVMLEVSKLGIKIDVVEIADGTAVTATSIDAATPVAELEFDLRWTGKGI